MALSAQRQGFGRERTSSKFPMSCLGHALLGQLTFIWLAFTTIALSTEVLRSMLITVTTGNTAVQTVNPNRSQGLLVCVMHLPL